MKRSNITNETIDYYLDQGFDLIPINREHGKRPLHKDWTKKEYTKKDIYRFADRGYNLGWRIPKGVCVVDVDPKNGGDEKTLQKFLNDFSFDECTAVKTGGHALGRHFYFKIDDVKLKEQVKDFPGIEFKTFGRQVIIPGSMHPDTKNNYEFWTQEEIIEAQFPQKLVDHLTYKPKDHTTQNPTKDQLLTSEELKEILSQLPVDEYNNNDDWFALMASVHSATDGEGLAEFLEWSTSDPNYQDDSELITLRWDSLADNVGHKRTIGSLILELYKHDGKLPTSLTAKNDFDSEAEDIEKDVDIPKLIEEIDQLPPDNFSDSGLEKYFNIIKNLNDNMIKEKLFKTLKSSLGVTLQSIRDAYKKYQKKAEAEIFSEKESIDYADMIADKILKYKFNDGKYLIHANNQQFYVFNGKYWEPIKDNMIQQVIYKTGKKILKTTDFDFKVGSLLSSVEKILIARCAVSEDVFGFEIIPPSVVNTLNYELWINGKTGKVRKKKHSYKSYLTHCIDVGFDIDSKCPVFDAALEKMFCNAKDPKAIIRYVWEIFGYILQSKKNLASWFLFHGHGNNGKSFLIEVMCKILGSGMVLPRNIAEFDSSNGNAHALASLPGKLLILDDDLRKDTKLPDGTLKKLSEAKFLEANPKGKETFNFNSVATPILLSNHWPIVNDISKGFLRRINIVPFKYELQSDEIDLNLIDKIDDEELQGVLNKALIGLQRLRKRERFEPPTECQEKIMYWLGLTNPVLRFSRTCCDLDSSYKELVNSLYDDYRVWVTSDRGYKKQVSAGQFEELLTQLGYKTAGAYIYGIKAKPNLND